MVGSFHIETMLEKTIGTNFSSSTCWIIRPGNEFVIKWYGADSDMIDLFLLKAILLSEEKKKLDNVYVKTDQVI